MYVRLKESQNYILTCQLNDNTITFDKLNDTANRFIKDYEHSVFTKKNKPKGLEKAIEDDDQQANTTERKVHDRVASK